MTKVSPGVLDWTGLDWTLNSTQLNSTQLDRTGLDWTLNWTVLYCTAGMLRGLPARGPPAGGVRAGVSVPAAAKCQRLLPPQHPLLRLLVRRVLLHALHPRAVRTRSLINKQTTYQRGEQGRVSGVLSAPLPLSAQEDP